MYFWRINRLKAELDRGPLAQGDALAYVLATMLMFSALAGVPGLWNTGEVQATATEWVGYVAGLILVVIGTLAAYRANGGGAGVDFAARYIALGWVLGLRLLVLVGLPGIVAFLVLASGLAIRSEDGAALTDQVIGAVGVVLGIGFEALYYWRLTRHFRDVRSAKAAISRDDDGS